MVLAQPVWFCEEAVIELSTLSVIGISAVKATSRRLNSPPVIVPMNRGVSPGVWVTTLMAPPMVLAPNSVPCGPLRISTRSTSRRFTFAPMVRARNTPSRYTPTPGFRLKAKSSCPMPRMEAESTERSPEKGDPASRLTLGVRLASWVTFEMLRLTRVALVNAVTAIGTSCSFSSRRSAVTTTSCNSCAIACAHPSTATAAYSVWRAYARTHFANERPIVIPPRKICPEDPWKTRRSPASPTPQPCRPGRRVRPARTQLSAHHSQARFRVTELRTHLREVEILLDRVGVLAHQRFHARALAALQRRDDVVMLPMRIGERRVHSSEARLVDGERLRTGERDAGVALERLLDDGTAALDHDQLVEAHVHVDVQRFGFVGDVALGEYLIALGETFTQRLQHVARGAVLRHAPCGETFQNAAQVDGVENIAGAEPADDVTPGLVRSQQPFLREHRQRLPYRRSRHAQQLRQRRLRHALSGAELPPQDHLADAHNGSGLMTVHSLAPGKERGQCSLWDPNCQFNDRSGEPISAM